ncbi:MAG TPA: RHS repeat-associated core domain-containing protein [Rhodanobacter sp.]|nr:RHS repeat-associated core domain-containing protein [Rhodanobacter sp.]
MKNGFRWGLVALGLAATVAHASTPDRTSTRTYNAQGLVGSIDGPRTDVSDVTSYTYDALGHLATVTDALGHVTTYDTYDALGNPGRIIDANQVISIMTYTPQGWPATVTQDSSSTPATTTLTYDAAGDVTQTKDADGVVVNYTYDNARRLTDTTDAIGNRIHYTLDAAGNQTKEEIFDAANTLRYTVSKTYNSLSQLLTVTDAFNRVVLTYNYPDGHNALGQAAHSADAAGVQRKQGYDGLERLVSAIDNADGTDTATQNTQSLSTYDASDNLASVTDPNSLKTTYTYDGFGNRTMLQSPDTGSSSYTYDAAGNQLTHTDANGVVSTATYDALNRLTSTSYPDTTLGAVYHYDEPNSTTGCPSSSPIGHLTRIVENAVSTVYCYDARGNVIRKQQIAVAATDTTLYAYTLANRLSMTSEPDGTLVSNSYNSNGQISGVQVTPVGASASTLASAITYLPFGPLSSYTLGNGQVVTRTYDANYRATDLSSSALNLHFARDAMGNVTAIGNAPGANPATETYSYDPLYRLTGISDNGTALESYTYSPTGDRLSKTAPGLATGAYLYTSGTHQLASIGTVSRANDANGNSTGSVIGGNIYGFAYNGRNRLTLVQQNGQTVGTYTYNALGQRIGKVATFPQAVTERYAYNQAGQLIGEYGTTNRNYIWLGDIPVAAIDNTINGSATTSTVNYVTADQLGTPRVVTNNAGTVVWQWAYQGNPFGEQQPTSTMGYVLNLRYPGQYYDAESGLVSNGMRPYEAALGRFDQSDPSGLAGGMSTYAADLNNPLSYFDPDGRHPTLLSNEMAANSHPSAWNHLVGAASAWWNQTVQDIATVGGVNPNANMAQAVLAPIRLGLTFSPMCLEEGAASAASAWPESSLGANAGALNAADFQFSQTTLNHIADRPYMDSTLLMQQIMDATPPGVDPGGIPLGLRWDSPGTMNGSVGTYQLVVDPTTNIVYHFQFKGSK